MSLLDKASLVQIPSGYGDGKLYSVKPTPTYGSELVVNGDFTTDSDWTKGSGWTIVNGEAVHTGSGDYIEQGSLVQGKNYRVVIVVTQASGSGFPQIYMGGLTTAMTSPNTYTFDITAQSGDKIKLRAVGVSCKVDSISVKEILVADGDFNFARSSSATRVNSEGLIETAQIIGSELVTNGDFSNGSTNWILSSNTSVINEELVIDALNGSYQYARQNFNTIVGKNYKLEFEITDINSGGKIQLLYNNNVIGLSAYNSVGTYTLYFTSTNANSFLEIKRFFPSNTRITIDNVSVKEVIENDVPRLDYSGGSCPSLLLEGQSTNLITYSEDFSQSYWAKNSVTLTSGFAAPDGSNNAYKIQGTINTSYIARLIADTNQRSIYAKTVSGTATVNLLGDNSGFTVTEDWQRFEYNPTSNTYNFAVDFRNGTNTTEVLIWGYQSEALSYATSYIPTSGSTVTRTADVCNNAGTAATFNSTEGVLFAEISALANGGSYRLISVSDGTNNNRVTLGFSNTSNKFYFQLKANNSSIWQELITENVINTNKIAFKYKSGQQSVFVNGFEVLNKTNSFTFSSNLNGLSFFEQGTTNPFYGKCKQLMVFDEALSDEELSDLTGQVNISFAELAAYNNYTIL